MGLIPILCWCSKKKESIKAKDSIHYSSLEIVGRQMIGFLEALAREKRVYLYALDDSRILRSWSREALRGMRKGLDFSCVGSIPSFQSVQLIVEAVNHHTKCYVNLCRKYSGLWPCGVDGAPFLPLLSLKLSSLWHSGLAKLHPLPSSRQRHW